MPLLGTGALLIWNGMEPGADADFAAWHVREHMPERLAVPGFLRGRRYVAVQAHPAYFNFYETATPAVLTSPAYLARLDDPSPWTRRVVARFRDTGRTACDVLHSRGRGEGGAVETVQMAQAGTMEAVLAAILEAPGITGVHLLRGRLADSSGGTAEKALRDRPDAVASQVLLVEAIEVAALRALRAGAGSDAALAACGARDLHRGLYAFQFGLSAIQGDTP